MGHLARVLRIACCTALLLCAANAPGEVFDGPYVVGNKSGGWDAVTVEFTGQGLERRVIPLSSGGTISISGVGRRPAFTVALRAHAEDAADGEPLPAGERMFFMADTHGEYEIATELLMKQGVIDDSLAWIFGTGRLVVLGDVFDRGPRQTEILWLLYKLEAEADRAGGRLIFLLGNHESMALTGNAKYLHSRYLRTTKILKMSSYADLWGADSVLGQWLRSKSTVFRLGRTLCLHGGVSPETVAGKWTIAEINTTVRAWLNGDKPLDNDRASFITGNSGPLWHRGHVEQNDRAQDIAAAKAFYDIDRVVVGHTKVDTARALYGGDVIAVQVYPTQDASGKMNMEGVYVDENAVWHRAMIDGTRRALLDDTD